MLWTFLWQRQDTIRSNLFDPISPRCFVTALGHSSMLDSIVTVISGLWHHNLTALQAPDIAVWIYIIVATLILLESAFIPAAPLPCDSVVILAGSLAEIGILHTGYIFAAIFVCAALGSKLAFVQGRWLNRLPMVQKWVNSVPTHRLETVDKLLTRHSFVALFMARFIPVVRSLLPLMMGMRIRKVAHFYSPAWSSAFIWTSLLVGFGYILPKLPEPISKTLTMILMVAPVITLCVAIGSWLVLYLKRKCIKSV